MKKALKIIGIVLGSIIGSLILVVVVGMLVLSVVRGKAAEKLYAQLGKEAPQLSVDGSSSLGVAAYIKINSVNIMNAYDPDVMALFNNKLQKIAERMRLGIPITIATDPRHSADNNPGAAILWCSRGTKR